MSQLPSLPPFGQRIETRIFDDNGHPIKVIPYSCVYEQALHGGFDEVKRADHVLLADGVVWNPSYAARQGEPLLLAVCHFCQSPRIKLGFRREPASTGLITLPNARACIQCGRTTCPRHRETNNAKARCHPCARRRKLWRLIRPLFFRRVIEE